jgi:hypothetical protein
VLVVAGVSNETCVSSIPNGSGRQECFKEAATLHFRWLPTEKMSAELVFRQLKHTPNIEIFRGNAPTHNQGESSPTVRAENESLMRPRFDSMTRAISLSLVKNSSGFLEVSQRDFQLLALARDNY